MEIEALRKSILPADIDDIVPKMKNFLEHDIHDALPEIQQFLSFDLNDFFKKMQRFLDTAVTIYYHRCLTCKCYTSKKDLYLEVITVAGHKIIPFIDGACGSKECHEKRLLRNQKILSENKDILNTP